jgi:hypothetical protein
MGEIVPTVVYTLCFATSAACASLLARAWQRSGTRLLMWSALCFALLAANNLFVILDLLVLRDVDLGIIRLSISLAAVAVLLFGFVWDLEQQG